MKHSFFHRQDAAITLLCAPESMGEAIGLTRTAEMDGADAVAIELQKMPLEQRTEENFRTLINSVQVLVHLQEQSSRGADILKIVVGMNTEKAMLEGIKNPASAA